MFRSPVLRAAALATAPVLATVVVGVVARLVLPDLPALDLRLAAVLALLAGALLVVRRHRSLVRPGTSAAWSALTSAPPAPGTRLRLLALPAALAVLPAAAGVDLPAAGTLAVLVVGYAATGVYEEVWFRGVVLGTLGDLSPRRAALVSGGLFGLVHLGNIALGANPAVTAAQVVGATCFGVGYAAARLRTGALVPLIVFHAVSDLTLNLAAVPGAVHWGLLVGHDAVLLVYGLVLLRPRVLAPGTRPVDAVPA